MDERRVFLVFPGFEHLKNQPEEDQTCAPRPVETHPVQGQAGVLLSTNSAQCEEVSPGCQGCAGGPGGGGFPAQRFAYQLLGFRHISAPPVLLFT